MKSCTYCLTRRLVAKRLLLAWVCLSLLLGTATYYLESRRLDNFVFNLTTEAAQHFNIPNQMDFETDLSKHHRIVEGFVAESRFAGIRLFDADKKVRTEAWKQGSDLIRSQVEKHVHDFPGNRPYHHNKIWLDKNLYIQILIPFTASTGNIYGYFEGVYQVEPTTVSELNQRVQTTLLGVVLVIGLTALALYPVIISLNREATNLSNELLESEHGLLKSLGSAIALRDSDTDAHNYRVTLYAVRLAEKLGISNDAIESLIVGAYMHDVGKIGIPDQILLKPGKLTDAEFSVMKTHVTLGENVIRGSSRLSTAKDIVLHHHEKFDGSGYPYGLAGTDIPLAARLFAIVDVFDALTSERPYKKSFSLEEAVKVLEDGRGRHFDAEMLDAFLAIVPELYEEIGKADEKTLHWWLANSIASYFKVGSDDTQRSVNG